jgi:hypothetical protein
MTTDTNTTATQCTGSREVFRLSGGFHRPRWIRCTNVATTERNGIARCAECLAEIEAAERES